MVEQYIEALIFASDTSIRLEEIMICLQATLAENIDEKDILEKIEQIKLRYHSNSSAIKLVKLAGGYQFLTKIEMLPIVNQLNIQKSKKKLSQAALETLSIIAYKQPITKLEVEQIRGVNCDYSIQKLLDKDLIRIFGKADGHGRPLLYTLSEYFLDYFGINSISDLPQLKDIEENNVAVVGEKQD